MMIPVTFVDVEEFLYARFWFQRLLALHAPVNYNSI